MTHIYQRRVQFADTDAAGVVHFSRLLCYVEEAEHALLEKLGIPLFGNGGWPRVRVECDYSAPLRMGEEVDIVMEPAELGTSSILWRFTVRKQEAICATGSFKAVRVDATGSPEKLNNAWREALSPYLLGQ